MIKIVIFVSGVNDKVIFSEVIKLIKFKFLVFVKVTKGTRKKFPLSWMFNILQIEITIPPNEEIIRHNICNLEL